VSRPVQERVVLVGSPGRGGQRSSQRSRGLGPGINRMLGGIEAKGRSVEGGLRYGSRGIRRV